MVKQAFENTLRGKRAAMSGTLPLSTRSSHPRAWDSSRGRSGVAKARAAESPEEAGPAAGRDRGALGRARLRDGGGERRGLARTCTCVSTLGGESNITVKGKGRFPSAQQFTLCGGLHTARACRRPARCAQPLRGDPLEREASFAHLYLTQSFLRVSAAACKNNTVG